MTKPAQPKRYRDRPCFSCGTPYTPAGPNQRYCASCKPAKQSLAPRTGAARKQWLREQESVPCRRCGAEAGQQCTRASGTISFRPHAERADDTGVPSPGREKQRARDQRKRARARERVFAHYGEVCACCGTAENLTIDHIDGSGGEHRMELFGTEKPGRQFYIWLIRNGFPEGLQSLCASCNYSKGKGDRCRLHDQACPTCRRPFAEDVPLPERRRMAARASMRRLRARGAA